MMEKIRNQENPGFITAGDPQTASAGGQVLQQGGSAADAVVGAMAAAFTAEPVLTGPFGGGFALISPTDGPTLAMDFFAIAPGLGQPPPSTQNLEFSAAEVSFGPTTQVFHIGRGAAAIPLMLPGLLELHRRFGRLPLAQVLQPAINLARSGATLSEQIAPILKILAPILVHTPKTQAIFGRDDSVIPPGGRFLSPNMAGFLQSLAQSGVEPAQDAFLKEFSKPHGAISQEDMQHRKPVLTQPIRIALQGDLSVELNPAPSSGGILVAFGLLLLQTCPDDVWRDEQSTYHAILSALRITQEARNALVDPAAQKGPDALAAAQGSLLSDAGMRPWIEAFAADRTHGRIAAPSEPEINLGGTTHISCIDAWGMACSMTTSNGEGCGFEVPGVGAMANNFMGEEDIHPNGFYRLPAGQRLNSMMCPIIVRHQERPVLAMGTGGSNRIRTALLQVLAHHLLAHKSIGDAVAAPRLHFEGGPLFVEREVLGRKLKAATLETLSKRVEEMVYFDGPNMFFGGVHVAGIDAQRTAGDPRRGGTVAEGF